MALRKTLIASAFFVALVHPQILIPQTVGKVCDSQDSKRILRTDESSKRLFVFAQAKEISSAARTRAILRGLQEAVAKCHSAWGKSWSASFFSEAKHAGYKDEPQLQTAVEDGSWATSYLGEYSRLSNKLTIYPANPKKVKTVRISVP